MSRNTFKVTLAGALVACGLGGFAAGLAWATPGRAITTTIISAGELDPVDVRSETDDWEVELKTRGTSDVYVVHNKVAPGGHTGWHTHPGPSVITVKAGTASVYHADDPDGPPEVYPTGASFVDYAGSVHLIANEGASDLELVAFQIVPKGAPRRIDVPQP